MKSYIGTKLVKAEPFNRSDSEPGYRVVYPDGYTSWSPKDVFEDAYRPCDAMSFGLAIEALKKGLKVARSGWNGKVLKRGLRIPRSEWNTRGMWLIMVPGRKDVTLSAGTPYANVLGVGTAIEILPRIDIWTVNAEGDRAMLPGWLAGQSDMLAEDWFIVD